MKIGIIGDCHFGASLKAGHKDPVTGYHSRQTDYYNTLIYAVDNLIERGCSNLVFTGDIFEHRYPQMIQQKQFSQALRYAKQQGIEKIYIVVGNHDQQRNSSSTTLAYLGELKLPDIIIAEDPMVVPFGDHRVYLFPYRDRRFLETFDYNDAIQKIDAQIKQMRVDNDSSGVHAMIGHMAIEGTFFPEEESDLYADNELMLLKSTFTDFNMTIMGHVHTPGQASENPPIYYIGSLDKRGAFEQHKKQYMVLDLDERYIDQFALPCRDFFEFSFDVSDKLYGADLMPEIKRRIEELTGLENNILKCEVILQTDDLGHLDIEKIRSFFADKKPSFIYPPTCTLRSQRTSRTELKESVSDTETWASYINSLGIEDKDFVNDLIQIGSSIMSEDH